VRLRLPGTRTVDYQVKRDNFTWADHVLRVQMTGALISWFRPDTILDPACGDGTIVAAAHRVRPITGAYLTDISMPNFYHVGTTMRPYLPEQTDCACKAIEDTLSEDRYFDVVVLTEILEHVEDPVNILRMARERAKVVVASSPLFADDRTLDRNPEHLWQFDAVGYEEMLKEGGWDPITFVPISFTEPAFEYTFQLWSAR
jgi:2-polyprenyl-3-methyl-5-hydroxy-6-metoxy-1,4-benzoquinol methylase